MIGVMILPSATKVVIVLNYLLHRESIIENYCVNIDQPMVMCNASCYLSDQFQKVDHQNDDPLPITKSLQLEIQAPCKPVSVVEKAIPLLRKRKRTIHLGTNLYSSDWLSDIFRPPCFNLI